MSNKNISVSARINILIGIKEIELSWDEAQLLYNELDKKFGNGYTSLQCPPIIYPNDLTCGKA